MRTTVFRAATSLLSLSLLTACPTPPVECIEGDEDVCDAGTLPPDFCDSPEEAETDSTNCHLAVASGGAMMTRKQGVYLSRLLDGGVDRDWYFAQLPALTPRSLLHVNGGYQVPQTAVNFTLNVLKAAGDGGFASVVTGIDRHGAAAPKPVDLVLPFSESNARLFVLVSDEGGAQVRVDNRNAYSVGIEVLDNPDVNEPNDTAPTAIALAPQGAIQQGQQTGYLATNDDVDLYSFSLTATGRQIIYLRITGPDPHPMNPPPPYRLAYTLYDPGDRPISEGAMDNAFLPIDLKTARLAPMTGTYKVKVSGYREPNSTAVIPGDLRVQYQVSVQLLPDLDTQEPNDGATTARAVTLSPNASRSLTGKIAYVADEEWFLLTLPARSTPSTLRYRLRVAGSGGRFEPLSGVPTRQLRVFTRVTTGATAQDRRQNCRANATLCPKGYDDPTSDQADLVGSLCDAFDPPLCLWAQRNEEPQFAMLKNHVGALPVAANEAQEFLLMLRDERLYADDRDWTIDVEWRDDADEASRAGGPTAVALSGTTATASGELSFGHGKLLELDVNDGDGVRGPNDYDAYTTDEDLFRFDFGGASGDQGWEYSWELQHPDGGSRPPGDITLELTFCQGGPAPDGGLCTGAQRRVLAYSGDRLTPWYQPASFSNAQVLFSKSSTATSTTFTALPVGCWCFSADRTAAGSFYANVVGVDRVSNEPIRYQVRQRLVTYPGAYSTPDGGGGTCPVADGGCGFAR